MDAVAERRPDEIIISTHPATSSGWLRRDLIERIQNASGLPVEHVVVDLEQEGLPFKVTLVLANKTSSGEELIEHLKAKAAQDGAAPVHRGRARRRTAAATRRARRARGWRGCSTACTRAGPAQLGHDRRPRPLHGRDERARAVPRRRRGHLDAARRALGLAALEPDRARPQRDLGAGRARRRRPAAPPRPRRRPPSGAPMEAASIAHASAATRHARAPRPPPANSSSRVEAPLLGMLLFIISEVMVFGAFFTAYFFIRIAAGRAVAGARDEPAGRGRGRQHRDPGLLLVHDPLGAERRSRKATASA